MLGCMNIWVRFSCGDDGEGVYFEKGEFRVVNLSPNSEKSNFMCERVKFSDDENTDILEFDM